MIGNLHSDLSISRISGQPWPLVALTLAAVVAVLLVAGDAVETANMRWLDNALRWRQDLHLTESLAAEIRIVEVDNQDLNEFGIDGEYAAAADTLRRLARLGTRVIVLDVLYSRGATEQQQRVRDAIDEARK